VGGGGFVNIIVLNGSPKGDVSVTMQYVRFMQKKFPVHAFSIVNVSREIKQIEKDEKKFEEIIGKVRGSDAVLWAFPLYFLLVPSQYKRFIELIRERRAEVAFREKYATALSTSIHCFDQIAHNYLHAVCDDLGMFYTGFYSADMQDLLKEEERQRMIRFAGLFFEAIQKKVPTQQVYPPLRSRSSGMNPGRLL
jgi:NAD(P)H-dependent FMN reductase